MGQSAITQNGELVLRNGSALVQNLPVEPEAIAPQYDSTQTYSIDDMVMYNGLLYKCTTAVSVAEDFDSAKWTATDIISNMSSGGKTLIWSGSLQITSTYTNLTGSVEIKAGVKYAIKYGTASTLQRNMEVVASDPYTDGTIYITAFMTDPNTTMLMSMSSLNGTTKIRFWWHISSSGSISTGVPANAMSLYEISEIN